MQGSQIHRAEFFVSIFNRVPEHLAKPGTIGAQHGFAIPLRQAAFHLLELFTDEAARKINVHVVSEIHTHVGEAKQRDGAHHFHVGQASHRRFNRHREQALDVFSRHTGRFCVDVHLCGRDIREGIYRHLLVSHYS